MSRHRNVRSMNFSDEYDGYDDVYGHSVEDDYCISPSDEAQFMYDRTRQPQMSAFFSEQDNIDEENCDAIDNKSERDCVSRPKLNDLDEGRLRSCLEEVRNVLGDNVSEQVLIETALKYDFDVNKCLDCILTNSPCSSDTIDKDAPKPQRIRRDRNADFINLEDHCFSTTKQLSHDELILEFQDSQLNSVQEKSSSVCLIDSGDTNKLIRSQLCHSSSSGEFCCQSCNRDGRENTERFPLNKDVMDRECEAETPSNLPLSSLVLNESELNKNNGCVLEGMLAVSDLLRTSEIFYQKEGSVVPTSFRTDSETFSSISRSKSLSSASGDNNNLHRFSNNSFCFDIGDILSDTLNDNKIPFTYLSERNAKMTSCKSTYKRKSEECATLDNVTESGIFPPETLQQNISTEMCSSGEVTCKLKSDKSVEDLDYSDDDDDDDEKSDFSPLAELAKRHLKCKSVTSDFSSITKPFSKLVVSCPKDYKSKDDKSLGMPLEMNSTVVSGESGLNLTKINTDMELFKSGSNANDDDSDDSDCSPLAALADKYLRKNVPLKFLPASSKTECANLGNSFLSSQSENKDLKCFDELHSKKYQSSELQSGIRDVAIHNEFDCQKRDRNSCSGEVSDDVDCGAMSVCVGDSGNLPLSTGSLRSKQELEGNCEQPALSLSDLAFHHLTRSASYGVRPDQTTFQKKCHSDTGISKSVPSGFVIPFLLKSEDDYSCSKSEASNCGEAESEVDTKGSAESDQSMDSSEDWVIDLSNALRKPELRLTCSAEENRLPATVIHVENAELQEEAEDITPCHLDASGILKMKFSYSRKRCSPFGRVLCHAWGKLSAPYIPRRKRVLDPVVRFAFDKSSPDDITLFHLNRKS